MLKFAQAHRHNICSIYRCLDNFLGLIKYVYYLDRDSQCNHTRLCNPVPDQSLIDDYWLIRNHSLLSEANSHSDGLYWIPNTVSEEYSP